MSREDILGVYAATAIIVPGGTLQIGGSAAINFISFKASTVGTSGLWFGGATTGLNAGYLLAANEVISGNFVGPINFISVGATSTLSYWYGLTSSGSTLLGLG